jgi:hypothetical protein
LRAGASGREDEGGLGRRVGMSYGDRVRGLLQSRRKRIAFGTAIAVALSVPVSAVTILGHAEAAGTLACKASELAAQATQPARGEPSTPEQAAIAARFAPILRYDSHEKLQPVDRARYVEHAQLWARFDCRHRADARRNLGDASLATLPATPLACSVQVFRACYFYLTLRGITAMRLAKFLPLQNELLTSDGPTVYWHVDEAAHTVQYWFFYVFNAFLNQHQGDWEQATLQLDDSMSHVTRVGLSSHQGGQSEFWTQLQPGLGRDGDHVIVYVARGSHANYFWRGRHDVPECVNLGCDRSDGAGRILSPSSYRLTPVDWPAFAGDYSTGNFVADGHKRVGHGINVADPQGRGAWTSPGTWVAHALPVAH